MKYPEVLSEEVTLYRILGGASIARYGDGEMNLVRGGNCVSQVFDPSLAQELRLILGGVLHRQTPESFIVGVPNLDPRCPKLANWEKQAGHFRQFVTHNPPTHFSYGSAFITRPDSAPWINTKEYFDAVQSLWLDQHVSLVANGKRSLTREFLLDTGAASVNWVECPYRDAYTSAGKIYSQLMLSNTQRVILCCGPTATVLADKLAAAGKHAIDLGHIGIFWRNYERSNQS